jgi:hypothetical protein
MMGNIKNDIHIEYLCNEPFWKFTKKGNESYCKVCKHHINDFSNFSKNDAIEYITKQGGETCGIFFKDQFIIDNDTEVGTSFKSLLFAGGLTVLLNTTVSAQSNRDSIKIEQKSSWDSTVLKRLVRDQVTENDTASINNEKVSNILFKNKKHRLRIGRTLFYINGRFPFLHIHRIRMGKIRYREK